MQIETKYNLGDSVVYMKNNRIQRATIKMVKTSSATQYVRDQEPEVVTNVIYLVVNDCYLPASEKEQEIYQAGLFPNAEELAATLVKEANKA